MSDHLPSEIVEEILLRLPVKSVVKFTSVCKAWNSLIKNQTFIHDHLNHAIDQASNDSIFLNLCLSKDIGRGHYQKEDFYSLYSVNQQTDHHFSVERFPLSHLFQPDRHTLFAGICNGLVCYADYSLLHSATILIWNPLLRKYVVLPKPIMTCKKRDRQHYAKYDLCFGLGFDSKNNDYKVVRLMNLLSQQETPHVEVYSLVSHSWKRITVRVPQFLFRYLNYDWLPPVFVNGAIHWIVGRGDDFGYRFILSFDVTEETFQELMLPQKLNHRQCRVSRLLVVEGGHSLAVVVHSTIICRGRWRWVTDIWVMKEYGINESWTHVLHLGKSLNRGISNILALTGCGKVVAQFVDKAIVLVDPIKKSVERLGPGYSKTLAGTYVESLFFLNNNEPHVLSF
ncbi:hypothetical protein QN277_022998 [Acacia crassicarpa]|uniref:F-box domain-containing protein n=1 Tax=Acacia crassicarpa TaxID=499986 RepID=A0AAE1JGC0_9FABA|nr:hypothetical protein QN277_022998 [Acacia crassicarpa]